MADKEQFIGFPSPLLGEENCRLRVLHRGEGFFVLEKPAGVLAQMHPWYTKLPNLQDAIVHQWESGKPEMQRLGIESLGAIHFVEPSMAGAVLFATNRQVGKELKDAYGSEAFTFTFEFVATAAAQLEEAFTCDLPLLQRDKTFEIKVSHAGGKKCFTHFRRLQSYGRYALWQATMTYPRLHQLYVHSMESDLPIVGEETYGRPAKIFLSDLKRGYRRPRDGGEEKPLYDGVHARLSQIAFTLPDEQETQWEVPAPKHWRVLLKRLAAAMGSTMV